MKRFLIGFAIAVQAVCAVLVLVWRLDTFPWNRPLAVAVFLAAILLVAVLYRLAARAVAHTAAKQARRACRRCGYDLTGNASGVCPECGTRIEQIT